MGLSTHIAALVYGVASLLLAFIALRFCNLDPNLKKSAFIIIAVMLLAIPLTRSQLAVLVLAVLALIALFPKDRRYIAPTFIVFVSLVPGYLTYRVPFPGLNYLLDLQFWIPLTAILLIPHIRNSEVKWNATDTYHLMFVLLVAVLGWRDTSLTDGARSAFYTVLYLWVPYMALSRSIRSAADLALALQALICVGLILASIAVIVQMVHWDFTRLIAEHRGAVEYRFGFRRIGMTLNTMLVGLISCLSLFLCWRWRDSIFRTRWTYFAACAGLLIAAASSGGRGAYLAMVVGLLCWILNKRLRGWHFKLGVGSTVLLYPILVERLLRIDFTWIADSGLERDTFTYRQQMIAGATRKIAEDPWFGDAQFLLSSHFDDLVTGLGIVDVVNRYLQIGLEYGLIGLFLFLAAYLSSISRIIRAFELIGGASAHSEIYQLGRIVMAFSVAYLMLIATTSDTSHVALFGVIFLAFNRAIVSIWHGIEQPESNSRAVRFGRKHLKFEQDDRQSARI